MEKIVFNYSLRIDGVERDKKQCDIKNFNDDMLRSIANGYFLIIFSDTERFLYLKTGILDYVEQISNVIYTFDVCKEKKTFAVSCDYYSNSLLFELLTEDRLKIIDENNEDKAPIICSYNVFKNAFKKFRIRVYDEILFYYPELDENISFRESKAMYSRNV